MLFPLTLWQREKYTLNLVYTHSVLLAKYLSVEQEGKVTKEK